jgi:hypothetical protein
VLPEFCGQLSPIFWNTFQCCRQPVYWSSLSFSHQAWAKSYKKGSSYPSRFLSILLNTESLQHQPQTFLTMLFYKSLVSFVTVIALASSVTASVTPERRYTSCQASSGSSTCCNTSSPFTALSSATQGLLALISPNLNLNLPVGLDCVASGVLGWYGTPRIFLFN